MRGQSLPGLKNNRARNGHAPSERRSRKIRSGPSRALSCARRADQQETSPRRLRFRRTPQIRQSGFLWRIPSPPQNEPARRSSRSRISLLSLPPRPLRSPAFGGPSQALTSGAPQHPRNDRQSRRAARRSRSRPAVPDRSCSQPVADTRPPVRSSAERSPHLNPGADGNTCAQQSASGSCKFRPRANGRGRP